MEQYLFETFRGLFIQISFMALLFGIGFIFVIHRLSKMKQQMEAERARIIETLMEFIAVKLNVLMTTENVNYEGTLTALNNIMKQIDDIFGPIPKIENPSLIKLRNRPDGLVEVKNVIDKFLRPVVKPKKTAKKKK